MALNVAVFVGGLAAVVLTGCGGSGDKKDDCPKLTGQTQCIVNPNAGKAAVKDAMDFICGDNSSHCPCDDANVAFNLYFQSHLDQGIKACDFDGAGRLTYPTGSMCQPNLNQTQLCHAKADATDEDLQGIMDYLCGGIVDCSPLMAERAFSTEHPGGQCVFPAKNNKAAEASWAMNKFWEGGKGDCTFGGHGELVDMPCAHIETDQGAVAYKDQDCDATKCDCSPAMDGKANWCRMCVIQNPNLDKCEVLCPWIGNVTESHVESAHSTLTV